MSGEVWLQCGGVCEVFSGVPVARPSWIVVEPSNPGESRDVAHALADDLRAFFADSCPNLVRETRVVIPVETPRAEDVAGRKRLLLLVAADGARFADRPWYGQWDDPKDDASVMTVIPSAGEFIDYLPPGIGDEHLLKRINAARWMHSPAEVTQSVLARADVTTQAWRIFISYRRTDTLAIALQLFDELTHEGFEVFLDRFSIRTGFDFQQRLNQELMDKSMVLLLESANTGTSKWTQHEINFAKRYRLGLMAVTMPEVAPANQDPSIHSSFRKRLQAGDIKDEKLTKPALDATTTLVKKLHSEALLRRRESMRANLVSELRANGWQCDEGAAGPVAVGSFKFFLATRPPDVADFHGAHAGRGSSEAYVVGPRAELEQGRKERIDWLEFVSGCACWDEGRLADHVRSLGKRGGAGA